MAKSSTPKGILYVGLDVHKDSIEIAVADADRHTEVRHFGHIPGDLTSFDKAMRKLRSSGHHLRLVYEAGPCGYVLYRHLTAQGLECAVIAPSLIPRAPGQRLKTDRRDAAQLARLHRAGELTPVYVPAVEDEARRDLTRAREDAKQAQSKARQQLLAFLLRHDQRYPGASYWTIDHQRWLADRKLPQLAQQIAFQEYLNAIDEATTRVSRLTEQIRDLIPTWRLAPVVAAIQALRGVSLVVASTVVAEVGDLTRFTNPRQLMAYLGLVPSEHSSGPKIRRGAITKAGNTHARRVLVEAAWSYRYTPRVTRIIKDRQKDLPASVRAIAWKAQLRLTARYRRLSLKGKPQPQVVTAVARELAAFIWAIAREVSSLSSLPR